MGIGIGDLDLGVDIGDWDGGGIEDWYWELGIRMGGIGDWVSGSGVGIGMGLELAIGDWDLDGGLVFGTRIGIRDCDWRLGIVNLELGVNIGDWGLGWGWD